ncbi:MAG: response regulator [Comamonas sp.]
MVERLPAQVPSTSPHILVVEDEPRLASVVCDYLRAAGYAATWEADGAQALAAFRRSPPALVLLDLMLPGRDGLDVFADIRAESDVPVIMVTARAEEIDRLLGLESGADDYICKPFSPRELVARVGVVLRRIGRMAPLAPGAARPAGPLVLDEASGRFRLHQHWLELTPVEFRLLRTLAAPPLRAWSRSRLMDFLYADHRVVTDRTVDSHVRNLRRKLAEAGAQGETIASIYGVGYRLEL